VATQPAVHRVASSHTGDWGWFTAWAAAGAALALGGISFGPILVAAAACGIAILAVRNRFQRTAFGLLSGPGIVALVVAWLNRQGPGTVYRHTGTASGADTYPDPRPWLVAGIVLVAVGLIGFVLARGTRNHSPKVEHRA
jgi:hypothetical protein